MNNDVDKKSEWLKRELNASRGMGVMVVFGIPFYASLGFATEGLVANMYFFLAFLYFSFGIGCFANSFTVKSEADLSGHRILFNMCLLLLLVLLVLVVVFFFFPESFLIN